MWALISSKYPLLLYHTIENTQVIFIVSVFLNVSDIFCPMKVITVHSAFWVFDWLHLTSTIIISTSIKMAVFDCYHLKETMRVIFSV